MNTNPDEQFEALLRSELRADSRLTPIPNLPEKAMVLAMSRQSARSASIALRTNSNKRRALILVTTIAASIICCILAAGAWSLIHVQMNDAAWNVNASGYADTTPNTGLVAAALASVAILVALLLRAVLDALDAESRQWPATI